MATFKRCDRCMNECNEETISEGILLINSDRTLTDDNQLDICTVCRTDFNFWFKNPKTVVVYKEMVKEK
jgi:hypothetical protein